MLLQLPLQAFSLSDLQLSVPHLDKEGYRGGVRPLLVIRQISWGRAKLLSILLLALTSGGFAVEI